MECLGQDNVDPVCRNLLRIFFKYKKNHLQALLHGVDGFEERDEKLK